LRRKMDDEGWVPLQAVAAFNRVRALTLELPIIVSALRPSRVVELTADGQLLRARDNWRNWVLPVQDRDPQAASTMVPMFGPGPPPGGPLPYAAPNHSPPSGRPADVPKEDHVSVNIDGMGSSVRVISRPREAYAGPRGASPTAGGSSGFAARSSAPAGQGGGSGPTGAGATADVQGPKPGVSSQPPPGAAGSGGGRGGQSAPSDPPKRAGILKGDASAPQGGDEIFRMDEVRDRTRLISYRLPLNSGRCRFPGMTEGAGSAATFQALVLGLGHPMKLEGQFAPARYAWSWVCLGLGLACINSQHCHGIPDHQSLRDKG
jgi:hypothetical protein